jgi:glycine/D-amino acid oxidase-like deaminating enzyme
MVGTGPCDVVVVGAGIVGAACAFYLADAGLSVTVVERGSVAAGTTGEGEGNILVSDKRPGPELDLALLSNRLWHQLPDEIGKRAELETKGGLVVARSSTQLRRLRDLASKQRSAGVVVRDVTAGEARELEPHLAEDLTGAAYYPEDMQVQPMLAAALLLRAARHRGAKVRFREEVRRVSRSGARVTGVDTTTGHISAGLVLNAAGTASAAVAALAGVPLPVEPRRGFIVVTEPLPRVIRHKVYSADYVDNVGSGNAGLETATVVEGTASGTLLIGASRERVGFDRSGGLGVVTLLCSGALRLFPMLADVRAIRYYAGFRPYCPDHLPVIGADPRLEGLFHASGHEGAGIGLAPATGHLIAAQVTGAPLEVALEPFSAGRFES